MTAVLLEVLRPEVGFDPLRDLGLLVRRDAAIDDGLELPLRPSGILEWDKKLEE